MRYLRQRFAARKQGEQNVPSYKACVASESSQSQGRLWRRRRAQDQRLYAMLAKRFRGKKSPRSERSEELGEHSASAPKLRATACVLPRGIFNCSFRKKLNSKYDTQSYYLFFYCSRTKIISLLFVCKSAVVLQGKRMAASV